MTNIQQIKPILFSTEMVKSILRNQKTQTRRIVNTLNKGWDANSMQFTTLRQHKDNRIGTQAFFLEEGTTFQRGFKCPYGNIGDILWVREASHTCSNGIILYRADGTNLVHGSWKPGIHMPRENARIFLQIINIRVSKVQHISDEEAIAEGIKKVGSDSTSEAVRAIYKNANVWHNYLPNPKMHVQTPRESFKTLINSVSKKGVDVWAKNPYTWVIEFKRVEKPVQF